MDYEIHPPHDDEQDRLDEIRREGEIEDAWSHDISALVHRLLGLGLPRDLAHRTALEHIGPCPWVVKS